MADLRHDHAREAALQLHYASEHMRDYALLKARDIPEVGWRIGRTEESLRTAAAILGFDLVARRTPQQAHEALLAARIAENGPEVFNDPRNEEAA